MAGDAGSPAPLRLKFTVRDDVIGGFWIMLFICTWLASMFSPLLLFVSFVWRESLPLGWLWWKLLGGIALLAYMPEAWFGAGVDVEGSFRQRANATTVDGFVKYFESVHIVYEERPRADAEPTLFCVHPHGIFARTLTFTPHEAHLTDRVEHSPSTSIPVGKCSRRMQVA